MKTHLFKTIILLTALTCKLFGQKLETTTITVEGFYTGKNLLIKNSYSSSEHFCIVEIKTNGHISPANVTEEIVEIPLDILHKVGVNVGDSVKVEIRYKLACSPKTKPAILNPGALLSYSNKLDKNVNRFTIEGEFIWGTLLVINPYNTANKTFCLKEIKVNGKNYDANLNKETVSIDLTKLGQPTVFNSEAEEKAAKTKGGFKEGDKIQIEFVYAKDSDPIILNPDLITPWSVKQ